LETLRALARQGNRHFCLAAECPGPKSRL
jgi:hypothetical protein